MANKTKIEWCDLTINPIIGCSKCSPGCENCYAERNAWIRAHNPKTPRYKKVVTAGKWNGKIDVSLKDGFKGLSVTGAPKRIFIGSMGDVFHENVSGLAIQQVFECMQMYSRHTFLLLTKRPEYMKRLMCLETKLRSEDDDEGIENRMFPQWPLPNVWLGVTVCNQDEADEKISILLSTPAAKRFVSIEPMLGPIILPLKRIEEWNALALKSEQPWSQRSLDQVIVGGETGPGARPMDAAWARSIRDQCKEAGVPFFFKKLSGKAPIPDDLMIREIPE